MNEVLTELQARQTIQAMQRARDQVQLFTRHAAVLRGSAKSLEARALLQEANKLLQMMTAKRSEFLSLKGKISPLSRSLSARAPAQGGPSPAAKWGNEFRAASKQLTDAVKAAEREIGELHKVSQTQINSPGRYGTEPETIVEAIINLLDLTARYVEFVKRKKP